MLDFKINKLPTADFGLPAFYTPLPLSRGELIAVNYYSSNE
jgi:hypothetical protein